MPKELSGGRITQTSADESCCGNYNKRFGSDAKMFMWAINEECGFCDIALLHCM